MSTPLDDYIIVTPGISGGKPRIKGRSITVQYIVDLHKGGWRTENMESEFGLTMEEINAALSYYGIYSDEVDASIREADELVKRLGSPLTSLKRRIEQQQQKSYSVQNVRQMGSSGTFITPALDQEDGEQTSRFSAQVKQIFETAVSSSGHLVKPQVKKYSTNGDSATLRVSKKVG